MRGLYDSVRQVFNLSGAIFLIMLSLGILAIAFIGQIDLRQPVSINFDNQVITVYYLNGYKSFWPVASLRDIQFQEKRGYFSIDAIPGQTLNRTVILTFKNQPRLTITEKRAYDLGFTPERLYSNLEYLYTKQLAKHKK